MRVVGAAVGLALLAGCTSAASREVEPPAIATADGSASSTAEAGHAPTVVAYITDYGNCDEGQQTVADMVDSWEVAAVVTGGDNTQGEDGCIPFEQSVGHYYGDYFADLEDPRFFPALGNHDYENETAGLAAYTRTFPYLPRDADPHGRWYERTIGPVTFFFLDTEAPPGDQSAQKRWLESALSTSRATRPDTWRVVVGHRPPYSSGVHGPWEPMQPAAGWELGDWGADLLLSGHQHVYEDVVVDGLHHITGTTGASGTVRRCGEDRVEGSRVCLEGAGALRLSATPTRLVIELHLPEVDDTPSDRVVLRR